MGFSTHLLYKLSLFWKANLIPEFSEFLTYKFGFILNIIMSSTLILSVLIIFLLLPALPSEAEEIRCERWQGKWWQKFHAVRCIKSDGAPSNNIVVTHKIPCSSSGTRSLSGVASPCLLKYTVGMWTGPCGEIDGQNRLYPNQYLQKRESQIYFFEAAGPGICKEFYVFECTKDGRPYDCYYAVRLSPTHAPEVLNLEN